jgi:hypothetical protein
MCLAHIPLEVDDDVLVHLKMEHFFDYTCLLKTCKLLLHTPMGEALLWECIHIVSPTQSAFVLGRMLTMEKIARYFDVIAVL